MIQNQNTFDRFARIIVGGICMLAASYISMPTMFVFVLLILGLYLMFSGLAGHCVLYKMLGIKTCK
ncbi:hypothetical protein AMJ44_14200 [candidate division WOR-1 bacterium DG_54_3]|uniref:Inner membrane protein YgaP-like transmembrane domain-containing protein n=1 Tax=candidate division WOR-1 bacterium DG_54_3 TaxID=1703775 RepID=A0A0S7XN79_UNCSA|nr:MAG: hypothetical protein AMJ44_14200 [candidate division WOR-1 bacterium DG_54_3]